MRQVFAIPIVDEIPDAGSEKEIDNKGNEEKKENDSNENNIEENIENGTDIQSIETEDLNSLFSF